MTVRILVGDCRDRLRELAKASVHCVVTSPPYFFLRDYGVDGQLGLESTPDDYASELVDVFREVRRVLRDDGTVWLNLGDGFAGNGGASRWGHLKPKDLLGMPWRVAFALQANGWYLRSDIVWAKKNPMPESVRDRPTRGHEFVFLLTKNRRYFYDAEAVREPFAAATIKRIAQATFESQTGGAKDGLNPNRSARRALVNLKGRAMAPQLEDRPRKTTGRNLRSVWHLGSEPFKGAHFATFPTRLVEPCIKAGTSEAGCCPGCGAPWRRVTERESTVGAARGINDSQFRANVHGQPQRGNIHVTVATTGWRPSCECADHEPVPCTVLDPFAGAGTTGLVADRLGRDALLIEINPQYAEMAAARIFDAGAERPEVA
jgi:DNA modification methylase